ncbi:hypothetical protein AAY473_020105 [Plecturocebus cupreus]
MPKAIDPQGCRRPSFRPAQTLWGFVSWKAVPAGISRKEFLEREDKDGLCCESSPKLKIEELNVPLARELETMTILSTACQDIRLGLGVAPKASEMLSPPDLPPWEASSRCYQPYSTLGLQLFFSEVSRSSAACGRGLRHSDRHRGLGNRLSGFAEQGLSAAVPSPSAAPRSRGPWTWRPRQVPLVGGP